MKKIKYHSWEYSVKLENGKKTYHVNPGQEIPRPDSLFRFYPVSKNSLEAITNKTFYVSQPDEFNDLFYFTFHLLDFINLDLQTIKEFIGDTKEEKFIEEWFEKDRVGITNFILTNFYSILLSKCGVVCLTTNYADERMWGYYNNHEGFCIEFDYKIFPQNFRGPFPINYVPKILPLEINRLGGDLTFLIHSNIKKDIWRHENEFRFIVEPSGNPFKVKGMFGNQDINLPFVERIEYYPAESIKSIILGFRFLRNEKFKIVSESLYNVEFTSELKGLKAKLFEIIYKEKIPCECITTEVQSFVLEKESWEIKQLSEFEFEIRR
jgi:hypothetical protein